VFGGSRGFITGLDVGSESVKAVRLQHSGDSVKLAGLALAEIDYPSAARDDGDPATRGARVQAIRTALAASGTDTSKSCVVVTAVEGPSISAKHVTFPKMPGPTLAESIGWEAKKHVPFGGSEFVLDFQLLPMESADAEDEMHVLLAAAEQRHIDDHVGLVCEAGVEPLVVDLAPLALMNELDEEGLMDGGAVAAIDIGVGTLSVSIYRKGGLLLVRSVRMPVNAGDAARGAAGDRTESAEARSRWQTFVLKEVQRSLAFYNTETGRRGIDRIFLTGGRALADGIAGQFTEALRVETEVLNPLERVESAVIDATELKPQGPRFALAMSLARRK